MSGQARVSGPPAISDELPTGLSDRDSVSRPKWLIRLGVERVRHNLTDPGTLLALLLIAALVVRIVWLWLPQGSLIFDENYYVNAARVLLGWAVPTGAPYVGSPIGLDPNTEHPPLGKLLIALSMEVFGDTGTGWRMPSVVAGMAALVAVYGIVRAAGETAWLGLFAVGFFAFDNLSMVHSRIATLDMMALAPVLIGAWLGLRGRWAWAGVAVAVGTLVKLTAVYGLAALLMLQALAILGRVRRERRLHLGDLRPPIVTVITYAFVFLVGLGLLDLRFTTFTSPFDHLDRMVTYGAALTRAPDAPVDPGGAINSLPLDWIVNDGQIPYLRSDVTVTADNKVVARRAIVDFEGAMNPFLVGSTAILATAFCLWLAWRRRNRLAIWALVFATANYLPYFWLAYVTHRITYLYYFLPVVPALAVAIALLLRRSRLPGVVTLGFLVAYAAGFVAYFPFRQIP